MTIVMRVSAMLPPAPVGADGGTPWRRLGPRLWAGRRDGRPVGTIERGRRYTAVDPTGVPVGRYRTFEEASEALIGLPSVEPVR